ncbi:hypothetical protein FALBO_11410 [Fusarium albosuccineum]|uniref:Uncharacterized protein n=1 Tax=Fusarium albosuccineum TaxID=1237068 RepID=A0A8H4L4A6_9HYPO|nr:hypothetical protein FALBO_11410 [Fusarium albosuccineum]
MSSAWNGSSSVDAQENTLVEPALLDQNNRLPFSAAASESEACSLATQEPGTTAPDGGPSSTSIALEGSPLVDARDSGLIDLALFSDQRAPLTSRPKQGSNPSVDHSLSVIAGSLGSWKQYSSEREPPPADVNVPPCLECLKQMVRKPGHKCLRRTGKCKTKTVKSCQFCHTKNKKFDSALPEEFVEIAQEIALISWRYSRELPLPENWSHLVAEYDRVMRTKDPSLKDLKQGMDKLTESTGKVHREVDAMGAYTGLQFAALSRMVGGLTDEVKRLTQEVKQLKEERNGSSGGA